MANPELTFQQRIECWNAYETNLLAALTTAIQRAATDHGIVSAVATYSGSGDNGQFDEITIEPNIDPGVAYFAPNIDGKREDITEVKCSFSQLVERYCNCETDRLHGGWENNDGASGEITIDFVTGTVAVDHNSYYTATDNTTTEFNLKDANV